MRFYLLGATVVAIATPLFSRPEQLIFDVVGSASNEMKAIVLSPIKTSYNQVLAFDFGTMIFYGYWFITALFIVYFLVSIFQVTRIILKSQPIIFQNKHLRSSPHIDKSFTFLQWIMVEESFKNDEKSLEAIVAHEQAHLSLGHSYDILFIQLFKTFLWWLPSAWLILKEIKNIHEYQADAQALQTVDNQLYSTLLISSTLKSHGLSLANSFYDGSIFKRLNTMKQKVKKLSKAKILTLSSTVILVTIFFACNDQLDQDLKDVAAKSYETTSLSPEAKSLLETAKTKNPNQEFRYLEYVVEEGKDISSLKEKITTLDNSLIESVHVNKEKGIIGIVMREGQANIYLTSSDGQEDQIYSLVDDIPEYPGGMEALYNDLTSQLKIIMGEDIHKYEGKVYVEFVVEKDGQITSAKTLKTTNEILSKPSLLAVANLKKWQAGKQDGQNVRVKMVLPINYQLSDNLSNEEKKATKGD